MVTRSVLQIFILCLTCVSHVHAGVSNSGLSFLTKAENEILSEAIRLGANSATIATGDGGWVHCFFGLDTVVWREGQMQSLCWGEEIKSTTTEALAISGISRSSYAFLFRGELQVIGGRDFLHWHNHWLTFGPASNWYVRDLNGDVPEVVDGRRVARLGAETLLIFDAQQLVRRLDVDQGEFTLIGEVQPELKNYLGSFQIIELWDYWVLFGDLGGGILKKSTQEFVMNHELKLASLVGVDGWTMVANSLHLNLKQNPEAVIIDADAIFTESAPTVLIVPSSSESSDFVHSLNLKSRGWALGLLVGWGGAVLFFRRKRHGPVEASKLPAAAPSKASQSTQRVAELKIEKVENLHQVTTNPGFAQGLDTPDSERRVKKVAQVQEPQPAVESQTTGASRGGTVEEIISSLIAGGDRQYSAAALNDQFGIAALSSDESQRARRARLVRQINDIYKRKHNRSLILRERDPKDRRHLIYRIKP